jgi:hypothetical protein
VGFLIGRKSLKLAGRTRNKKRYGNGQRDESKDESDKGNCTSFINPYTIHSSGNACLLGEIGANTSTIAGILKILVQHVLPGSKLAGNGRE